VHERDAWEYGTVWDRLKKLIMGRIGRETCEFIKSMFMVFVFDCVACLMAEYMGISRVSQPPQYIITSPHSSSYSLNQLLQSLTSSLNITSHVLYRVV
jgi:hypothetical protein